MQTWPLRLSPGADLRRELERWIASRRDLGGAFVVAGVGSLAPAALRLAGAGEVIVLAGDVEILTLCGTLSIDGAHLHMSVADAQGHVTGGHVGHGSIVRTTAELLIAPLSEWQLRREADAATGYAELVVRPMPG